MKKSGRMVSKIALSSCPVEEELPPGGRARPLLLFLREAIFEREKKLEKITDFCFSSLIG